LFTSLRRRLVLSYAAIFTISLLLLGPVLYLSFAQQLDDGFDTTLRLAAQRQALRAFVADASHELRTPLTLMRTNVEVLLEAGAVLDPEDRALLEDVVAEAEHMGRLIADLLTLARLDAGALPLARDLMDLGALVTAQVRQVGRLAARQGVEVRADVAGPAMVRGDVGRLEQVLLILLDNAIKYNRPGGTVDVTLRREGSQAVLTVRDTGPGIPEDELPRLFARFHRGRGAGAKAEGSGLGLTIARGIIQSHHGRLRMRSTVGVGSTFTALLPLAARAEHGRQVDLASTPAGCKASH